ncbi:HAD family hydrolase [Nonomuraea sp. NPDC050691]|uniref:HAD family hydrolase n=1 Tax=Nonomuraea sp. NPDC050691 TaxID=3155661 RepID=UPI0034113B41
MQRLALFDLDRTLIDLDAAFFRWAEEFAKHWRLGPEGVAWLVSLDQDGYPHREVFFGKVREHFALAEPVDELWAAYRRRMPHLVRCYPGVLPGLAELRAEGWRVGIVTNGMADNQLGKLRRTGLADAVDGYAVSGVEGIRKPQARLFHIAAERCGASLAQGGWMVGDNHLRHGRRPHGRSTCDMDRQRKASTTWSPTSSRQSRSCVIRSSRNTRCPLCRFCRSPRRKRRLRLSSH